MTFDFKRTSEYTDVELFTNLSYTTIHLKVMSAFGKHFSNSMATKTVDSKPTPMMGVNQRKDRMSPHLLKGGDTISK